ncbi:MAG TPA: anthranilate synthase component I [Symbiobacteriaceae bacterium]|nr:anthranilate synthase component I [Symbiobacteriaceae bacterium]
MEPRLDRYRQLATEYDLIPVYREILADLETPISVLLKLEGEGPFFLLESVEGGERSARYSFLGFQPFALLTHQHGQTRLQVDETEEILQGDPLAHLEQLLARFTVYQPAELPRFWGGAVGSLGYDVVRYWEHLPQSPPDDRSVPDAAFMLPGLVIIFDRVRHKLQLVVSTRPGADPQGAYRKAEALLDEVIQKLRGGLPAQPAPNRAAKRSVELPLRSNWQRPDYEAAVETVKAYIQAGDAFQVVPSQRFQTEVRAKPLDIYRALRMLNPSPYLYYLSFGEFKLIGASPELLVRMEKGIATTRPIAGTRKRGATEAEDLALEAELLADAKEQAEHLMLVDLGRNDLGRVCIPGTVKVTDMARIERFSHVMHIVSDVQGEVNPKHSAFDLFRACFPAGTLSGAPKVRAMQVIDELEPTRRGPYGGAVGYFTYDRQTMDTCICIRTVVLRGAQAYIQAGGGVVADSNPAAEFEETVNKAQAVIRAITLAEEGIE